MISAISSALWAIRADIPLEILEATFKPYHEDTCLDYLICSKVIQNRVLNDVNMRGGKIHAFNLDQRWCRYTDSPSPYVGAASGAFSTYVIPPEARDHRDINSIIRVDYPYWNTMVGNGLFLSQAYSQGNAASDLSRQVLSSKTMANITIRPTVTLMAGNAIMLRPAQYDYIAWRIVVKLNYDKEFTNMENGSIDVFKRLCVAAVKAYIYNTLIFEIETNVVYRGMDIGVMKDIVSSYSDANSTYNEELQQMTGREVMDSQRLSGIIKLMI